ncbi:MAG: small multi-drug export protein [Clostridiales bacterium]|nr:small multi-drug export protein [Clostridiales bacterium]
MLADIAGGEIGQFMSVLFTAMLPVLELRAAIPFGASLRLPFIPVVLVSIIGNMLPVPFILLLMRHILNWMRSIPRMARWAEKIETRAHLKSQNVKKYRWLGLCILVAIPLPGTGAWTGAMVATVLNMRLRDALPSIFLGVCIAAALVSMATLGVVSFIHV